MITISQMANIIEDLYNDMSKTNTNISITITPDTKKCYGSYGSVPNNISANIQEISCNPIGIDGVVSYQSAYNIEMLVPENFNETNTLVWKSMQMEHSGRLIDLSDYSLSGYILSLSFEDCIETNFQTRSNGNCRVVNIVVRASVDVNIVNGSDHTFAIVVNNTEYNLPFTRYELGEVKNVRAGNFSSNGRIGSITQSQNFSATIYCVLPKNNLWLNVVLPILLGFSNYEGTLKIGISGTTYVDGQTDNRASIPVIINVLSYNGQPKTGVVCALNFQYRG